MDPEFRKDCETVFKILEQPGLGGLPSRDVVAAFKALEIIVGEEDIFREFERHGVVDENSLVSLGAFVQMAAALRPKVASEVSISRSFALLDDRGKGYVDTDDLRQKVGALSLDISSEDLKNMMKYVDCDEKGFITAADFVRAVKKSEEFYAHRFALLD